jgi:uncharacterized protein YutE (UPF0331/DUF86 family)
VDRIVLDEKLESLRRCVARIETARAPSAEALRTDVDRQDILSLNLTRAVQLCVDIASRILSRSERAAPQSMGEAFDLLVADGVIPADLGRRMRAAVGFRNIAIHAYRKIEWDIVHAITHEGVEDFRRFAACVDRLAR